MLLGAIADDLTGATDLALMIARQGMKTVQVIGVPSPDADYGDAAAVVVALKSRTIAPGEAVAQSLSAAQSLKAAGAEQIFFKYCSTFDSTDKGNIGPVAESLLDFTGAAITIACPAFPAAGRTVYRGHLFVGDRLLSDSPMKDHPLTPMRDADLVRVLQRQMKGRVGLLPYDMVDRGAGAIREAIERAEAAGIAVLVVDAVTNAHLLAIGRAAQGMALVTGGSGLAIGLPENFARHPLYVAADPAASLRAPPGRSVILAGSCSAATQGQVARAIESGVPTMKLDAIEIAESRMEVETVLAWADAQSPDRPPLITSSADPSVIGAVQKRLGAVEAGNLVEEFLAKTAKGLLARGFSRFVVAGGETSGAVVGALGVKALEIGPEIDPGVPWTRAIGMPQVALALKSGNFGTDDFFEKAWQRLD